MLKSLFLTATFLVSLSSFSQLQFTQVEGTPFFDIQESTVTKFDVEGDGDIDIVITGTDDENQGRCDLFLNNGDLNFTLAETAGLPGVQYADAEAGDVDGNGTIDLFVSGFFNLERFSELYLNDGNGNFTISDQNDFAPVMNSHAVFFDADGDDDLDLIYSGKNPDNTMSTRLYLNDGAGIFSEDTDANFLGLSTGALDVADINNDGYEEVLVIGRDNSGDRQVQLYLNESGVFSPLETDFPAMSACSIEFFDANGDIFIDVLLSGSAWGEDFTNVFLNNGDESFGLALENDFNVTFNCHSATVDVDNDGDLDVMINGEILPNQECTLYINDGNGIFTEDTENLFPGTPSSSGEVAFEDFDQDGTPEFLVTGYFQPEGRIAKLYTLDEANALSEKRAIDYKLFPNPSTGLIYLDTSDQIKSVKVLDANAKIVVVNAWENGSVNCENLPTGNYTLVIQSNQGWSAQNIVVQR